MRPEKIFLAVMRSRGYIDTDFKMEKGRYVNAAMHFHYLCFGVPWDCAGHWRDLSDGLDGAQ